MRKSGRMTHAFSELYIENAQRVFAQMTHYVIYDLKMEYDPFFRLFVQSGVAGQFEKGNNSSKRISVRLHMKQYAAWLTLFTAHRRMWSTLITRTMQFSQ